MKVERKQNKIKYITNMDTFKTSSVIPLRFLAPSIHVISLPA